MPEAGQVGGAADHHPLLGLARRASPAGWRAPSRPCRRSSASKRVRQVLAPAAATSANRRPATRLLSRARRSASDGLAERRRAVDHPLLDPAGVGDQHEHQPGGRERDQLHVPHGRAGQRRVLHDGDLPGELGEQPHRPAHHVVEVDRAVEEALDGPPLGRRQRLDAGEPVDEEPVALVGGDAAGAGVRLGDVALVLQGRHVVAHGRRGDPEVVPLGEGLGADRLLGGDVVLDDGAQHLELAFTQHRAHLQQSSSPRHSRLGTLSRPSASVPRPSVRLCGYTPGKGSHRPTSDGPTRPQVAAG